MFALSYSWLDHTTPVHPRHRANMLSTDHVIGYSFPWSGSDVVVEKAQSLVVSPFRHKDTIRFRVVVQHSLLLFLPGVLRSKALDLLDHLVT